MIEQLKIDWATLDESDRYNVATGLILIAFVVVVEVSLYHVWVPALVRHVLHVKSLFFG
jgi:hypothetical protein